MTPGATSIYKCPNCGRFTSRGSINSGNTFGATRFSDGYMIAPMLPEFPSIVKCEDCKTFYWLNKDLKIGEYYFKCDNDEWKKADNAKFLTIDELQEAINCKIYNSEQEQKYLRRKLWWAFNDKIRKNDLQFSEEDAKLFEENCLKLLELLNKNNTDENIMTAELFRNLGKFSECHDILENITEKKYFLTKKTIEKECNIKNRKVTEIKQ